MPRAPIHLPLLVALAAGACEESEPLSPIPVADHALEFTIPHVGRNGRPPRPDEGPTRPAPASTELEAHSRPLQQIRHAMTNVNILQGEASALGRHRYIGNVGSIDTTVQIVYGETYLGSFTAERQAYTPFIFDFGMEKSIYAYARVFTDHTCGLRVVGSSIHRASWQFYQGRSAPIWGETRRTTQADPESQPECAKRSGRTQITETRPTGMVCTYLITYDLDTGEWLNAELLFCSGVGAPRI